MVYVFHFLVLCLVVLTVLFYFQIKRFNSALYSFCIWQNTINLESVVREIIVKACIIAIIDSKGSKLTDEEKENKIIENASSISADVLLQHNIEPRNYNLEALTKVEIFRISRQLK